jgi:hypothetical protein
LTMPEPRLMGCRFGFSHLRETPSTIGLRSVGTAIETRPGRPIPAWRTKVTARRATSSWAVPTAVARRCAVQNIGFVGVFFPSYLKLNKSIEQNCEMAIHISFFFLTFFSIGRALQNSNAPLKSMKWAA